MRRIPRGLIALALLLTVLVPSVGHPVAAREAKASPTWKAFLADRIDLYEELAPAFISCFKRRDSLIDPLSPIFHGCLDWHSAVHAAYSHHALYRRTGKEEYLELAQAQIAPQGVSLIPAEEIYERAKGADLPLTENPYGFGWFLILAKERELSTEKDDFRAMADYAAEQMVLWFEERLANNDSQQYILNTAHPNYSWSLINLDVWARYTKDKELLAATRKFAEPLLADNYDTLCPVKNDQNPKAGGFQPACLMRLAAAFHVHGDALKSWVAKKLPKNYSIPPVEAPSGCHAGGLNFTRAFALYQLYLATGNADYRDNYAELIRFHVGHPEFYMGEMYGGNPDYLCYSHWVAQVGVRAISLSYND